MVFGKISESCFWLKWLLRKAEFGKLQFVALRSCFGKTRRSNSAEFNEIWTSCQFCPPPYLIITSKHTSPPSSSSIRGFSPASPPSIRGFHLFAVIIIIIPHLLLPLLQFVDSRYNLGLLGYASSLKIIYQTEPNSSDSSIAAQKGVRRILVHLNIG
ncbi:hypothetical protein ABKV19_017465 [Rosa sericea]